MTGKLVPLTDEAVKVLLDHLPAAQQACVAASAQLDVVALALPTAHRGGVEASRLRLLQWHRALQVLELGLGQAVDVDQLATRLRGAQHG